MPESPLQQRGLFGFVLGRLDQLGAIVSDAVDQPRHLTDLDPVQVTVAAEQPLVDRRVRVEPPVPVAFTDGQRHPVVDLGQWARGKEGEGWRVSSADFEMGVKSNGFPIAYTQVCLSRTR